MSLSLSPPPASWLKEYGIVLHPEGPISSRNSKIQHDTASNFFGNKMFLVIKMFKGTAKLENFQETAFLC